MRKSNKKGFTMVELVIVIAVIAILAAVLIPTFINLYRKAHQSVDLQLITNLNKVLASAEATDGKNETMYDALQDAFAAGYDITKISPTDEGDILWDQTYDRFLAVDENGEVVGCAKNDEGENMVSEQPYQWWKIYTAEIPAEQKYSVYWAGESAPSVTTFSVGFDMGEYCAEDVAITIDSDKADIIVRVNENGTKREEFAALTVNAQSGGHIHLYGVVRELTFAPNGGKLCVHAFVAELKLGTGSGKLASDGAKYHESYSEIEAKFTTDITHETILAEYAQHYPTADDCFFHSHEANVDPKPNECKHENVSEDYKAPTCTEAGYRKVTCNDCHEVIKEETFAALGHDLVVSNESVEPTCEAAGHTAYKICRRCHEGFDGTILAPLMHNFDETGKCTRCEKMKSDVAYVELEYKDGKNTVTKHNMDDFDIAVNSYIVMLKSDITTTPEEFSKLLGTMKQALFVKYENGHAVAGETFTVDYSELFAVDVDLNGQKLTIQSESSSSDGIVTLGKIRVRDDQKPENANLILRGKTGFGPIFALSTENAEAEFKNLTVDAKHYPIYLADPKNKLTVTDSTLTIPEKIIATSSLGQDVTIYFEVKAADGSSVQPNWDNSSNRWCSNIAPTYENGNIQLDTAAAGKVTYDVIFYTFDRNNQKVKLENQNYFSSDYGYQGLVEKDTSDLMYFNIFGCNKEIKCDGGNDNASFVVGTFEEYWFDYNDNFYEFDRTGYTNVNVPENSVTLSKVAD